MQIGNETNTTNDLAVRIEKILSEARQRVVAVVNTSMVYTYYEVGRMIVEDEQNGSRRAAYGKSVLKTISAYLAPKFGKGFSVDNLQNMRNFYLIYSKYETPSRNLQMDFGGIQDSCHESPRFALSWSHYLKLMRIENVEERNFYEIEATANHWSLRELERQYDSSLYERLALSRNKDEIMMLSKKGQIIEKPQDMLKDPYVLEFTGLPELPRYSEKKLEQKLIDNLQTFLLELGKGFTFVGRQVRITFSEEHYYIDLVFYNRLLRCFVLIDLKRGKLKHQDIGQMQMYVNYYDREVRIEDENPTIGLLLCADKDDAMIEYTLPIDNNQIFAAKYKTILPSKNDLKRVLLER